MPTPLNPYIAGNPVGGGAAFIGRADMLREVLRVLRNPHQNALVLYGQRRIGKTSVLLELMARLPNEGPYHPVFFDLQDKAAWPLGKLLQELAQTIAHSLDQPDLDLGSDPETAFREVWLPTLLNSLPLDSLLVLLFDEFDVLADPKGEQAAAAFFPYLRQLIASDPQRLDFVFVTGRKVADLTDIALSLFKGTPSLRVSLLNREDTIQLVRLAEANHTLRWPDETVERVYRLTNGHPLLTQQLCYLVWEKAQETEPDEPPTVTVADMEMIVSETLKTSEHALEWLWKGLPPAERVVASTLAAVGPQAISQKELDQRLRESGVRILIGELQDAPRVLQEWDLIEPVDGGYHFRVELLRRWIAERKPPARAQEDIDRIQPVADNLFRAAYDLYQSGQLDQAIPLLRQAIGFNPNHLQANQILAEILLAQGELVEARQILETLFQYQPAAAVQPRLVQTILRQAQEAKNDEERLALYERVLKIEPNQPEAAEGRRGIWQKWGDEALAADDLEAALDAYRRVGLAEKAAEVEAELRRRRLEAGRQEVNRLEQERHYQAALDLARQLHAEFPAEQSSLPDLALLERKTRLDDLYQRALGALQANERETAQKLLVEVVSLEPGYQQGKAARNLLLAVTGDDIDKLQAQLVNEKKLKQQAEAKTEKEVEAHQRLEAEVIQLQNQLNTEKEFRQKAEVTLQQWSESLQQNQVKIEKMATDLEILKSQIPTEGTVIQKTDAASEKKPSWRPWDKWLIGALTWLPFLLPNLALGLTFLTPVENVWSVQTYLWISGIVLLAGLLATMRINFKSEDELDILSPGLMVLVFLVCFFTTYSAWQIWGILSAVVVCLITIVVVFIGVFALYSIGGAIAEQLPIIGRGTVLVILIPLIPLVTAGGLTGNLVSNLFNLAKIVVLIDLTLVFVYWLVRGLREAKDNVNHSVWVTRAIYGGLVAAFGFVIWYTFLGGQAFL